MMNQSIRCVSKVARLPSKAVVRSGKWSWMASRCVIDAWHFSAAAAPHILLMVSGVGVPFLDFPSHPFLLSITAVPWVSFTASVAYQANTVTDIYLESNNRIRCVNTLGHSITAPLSLCKFSPITRKFTIDGHKFRTLVGTKTNYDLLEKIRKPVKRSPSDTFTYSRLSVFYSRTYLQLLAASACLIPVFYFVFGYTDVSYPFMEVLRKAVILATGVDTVTPSLIAYKA
eukprot:sb/3469480/